MAPTPTPADRCAARLSCTASILLAPAEASGRVTRNASAPPHCLHIAPTLDLAPVHEVLTVREDILRFRIHNPAHNIEPI